jgi:hypothetical protein
LANAKLASASRVALAMYRSSYSFSSSEARFAGLQYDADFRCACRKPATSVSEMKRTTSWYSGTECIADAWFALCPSARVVISRCVNLTVAGTRSAPFLMVAALAPGWVAAYSAARARALSRGTAAPRRGARLWRAGCHADRSAPCLSAVRDQPVNAAPTKMPAPMNAATNRVAIPRDGSISDIPP